MILNKFQVKLFLQKKIETKAIKISALRCLQVEKFNVSFECLLSYTHPILYLKCIDSEIQTTVKPDKLSSVMTVCRHNLNNGVMADMSQNV